MPMFCYAHFAFMPILLSCKFQCAAHVAGMPFYRPAHFIVMLILMWLWFYSHAQLVAIHVFCYHAHFTFMPIVLHCNIAIMPILLSWSFHFHAISFHFMSIVMPCQFGCHARFAIVPISQSRPRYSSACSNVMPILLLCLFIFMPSLLSCPIFWQSTFTITPNLLFLDAESLVTRNYYVSLFWCHAHFTSCLFHFHAPLMACPYCFHA